MHCSHGNGCCERPLARVRYIHAERYVSDGVSTQGVGCIQQLLDALLIDDISSSTTGSTNVFYCSI